MLAITNSICCVAIAVLLVKSTCAVYSVRCSLALSPFRCFTYKNFFNLAVLGQALLCQYSVWGSNFGRYLIAMQLLLWRYSVNANENGFLKSLCKSDTRPGIYIILQITDLCCRTSLQSTTYRLNWTTVAKKSQGLIVYRRERGLGGHC